MFGYDRVTRPQDVERGLSNTMMVIETRQGLGPWTAGGPATIRGVDPATKPYIGPGLPWGGYHRGGTYVLFADGSVRFIKDTVEPRTFEMISTIAGYEVGGGCF
jgi:prepilin-type processing-associated H-X9-DG protein